MTYLKVRVTPGAREDAVAGWLGDVLRVRVTAAPERGRANDAVCRLLARRLGVPPPAVTVTRGLTSRDKLVTIAGLSEDDVRRRLSAPIV